MPISSLFFSYNISIIPNSKEYFFIISKINYSVILELLLLSFKSGINNLNLTAILNTFSS